MHAVNLKAGTVTLALATMLLVACHPPRGGADGDRRGGPPARKHTATQIGQLDLLPATQAPVARNTVSMSIEGGARVIRSNNIAAHNTGPFPNAGNPNGIEEINDVYRVPLNPEKADKPTFFSLGIFGIGVNGVLFEPQAAEWFLGNRSGGWQYDPLGAAVALGLDEHHAHVQPTGKYHYHGLPTGLLEMVGFVVDKPSPLLGWAMDGFPIYALHTTDESGNVTEMRSSYRLKSGARPNGEGEPGGSYDGTFIADYTYVNGSGNLDECNGAVIVSEDYPEGTYAYFLTEGFPVIPRCFAGTPSDDARVRP